MMYFDKQEFITLDDWTQLVKEYFSEGEYPFIECEETEATKLLIATDPANFEKLNEHKKIYELVKQESDLEFDTSEFGRKSQLPAPETVITITIILAMTIGIIKSKVTEKLGDAIGEDLAKFYKLLSKLAVETIKKAKPSNRPKSFVISYPNPEWNVELVITTHKADKVLNSLPNEKLKIVAKKVEQLKNFDAEKIQFKYNDSDIWEFNYLLTKTGAVIGTIKSFNKRNELYNKILEKQNNEEKGSSYE